MAQVGTFNQKASTRPGAALLETFLPPLIGGLLILVTLIGLIGTAIKNPQPHDIPVGLGGPAQAAQQVSSSFAAAAPGAFQFTTSPSEQDARAALDSRTLDGVLVVGQASPRLIVAGAAGDAPTGVMTATFNNVFKAQGAALAVETVHPFAGGDAHGLVLFFVVVAALIAALVAQVLILVSGTGAGLASRLAFLLVFAALVGLSGMGPAGWIVGGYGGGFWAAAGPGPPGGAAGGAVGCGPC